MPQFYQHRRQQEFIPAESIPEKNDKIDLEASFQTSLIGMFNKRGYNIQETVPIPGQNSGSETSDSSFGSNCSSISTSILSLREPIHGQAPIHIAIRKGDRQVLQSLLVNEAASQIINLVDNNGNTALHFACGIRRMVHAPELVEQLIDAGSNVHIANKKGYTPIMVHLLTVKIDDPRIVTLLLKEGSDANSEIDMSSLLHLAMYKNLPLIAGALVSYGALISAINKEGLMVCELAAPRVMRSMVSNIKVAQPYVTSRQRTKCMGCGNGNFSMTPVRGFMRFFYMLFRATRVIESYNCYHCGLIFCSNCVTRTTYKHAFPPNFGRGQADDVNSSHLHVCKLCDVILTNRSARETCQMNFNEHLLGGQSTAAA